MLGPEPHAVFGAVGRPAVLAYLAAELLWGLEHATEAYAVLNACRALVYLSAGAVVSKLEGGQRALDGGFGPAELIARAMGEQRALRPPAEVGADAVAFVAATVERLRSRPCPVPLDRAGFGTVEGK